MTFPGKVHLAIVDIDDLASLSSEIRSVPTVVAFKNGRKVDQFVGLIDEDQLDAFVQKLCV
jgi:thioredoxin-like negative regulator of GroEL